MVQTKKNELQQNCCNSLILLAEWAEAKRILHRIENNISAHAVTKVRLIRLRFVAKLKLLTRNVS